MTSRTRKLRSGYTTGACAAAAAKASVYLLLGGEKTALDAGQVTIPFPDGSRAAFAVRLKGVKESGASASVIKDGGDDPDVTNNAEIAAEARFITIAEGDGQTVSIQGGEGVGVVTKPGLSVSVGEPAINAVPRKMIRAGVMEAVEERGGLPESRGIAVTISVPRGEELAKKTLNERLGIRGGISILGTTGIVRPLSSEAWMATVAASIDVARAVGMREIVLSTGRVSEKAHAKRYAFPEEAYAMMGDYVEFSLRQAGEKGFAAIHICAQWAKLLKISLATPHTHVRHGVVNTGKVLASLKELGMEPPGNRDFNTARAVFDYITAVHGASPVIFKKVCRQARGYAESVARGTTVVVHLVSYEGEIISDSG